MLIQVFERRVLTFTPTNDPAFQVEMGNIGQHYYTWRYSGAPVGSASPPTGGSSSPTTQSSVTAPIIDSPPAPPPPFPTILHKPIPLPSNLPPPDSSSYIPPTNLSCASFHSQAAAQEFLRIFPNDPDNLDPGKTGIACPNNPAPFDMTQVPRR